MWMWTLLCFAVGFATGMLFTCWVGWESEKYKELTKHMDD